MSILVGTCRKLHTVWPDWAIYWTLGNFLMPLAAINLPKSPTFLGNFYWHLAIFFWLDWLHSTSLIQTFWSSLVVQGRRNLKHIDKWTCVPRYLCISYWHGHTRYNSPTLVVKTLRGGLKTAGKARLGIKALRVDRIARRRLLKRKKIEDKMGQ